MDSWTPKQQLDYLVTLGVKNRKAEFTTDFGGEALPEQDSVPRLEFSESSGDPRRALVKLMFVLKHSAEGICLDGPTARSITGEPRIRDLVHLVNQAVGAGLARRTGIKDLDETDRDRVVGLEQTPAGRELIDSVLAAAPPRR